MFGKSIKLIIDNLDKNQDNQFTLKFLDALLSCDFRDVHGILTDIDNRAVFDRTFLELDIELGVIDILVNIVNVLNSNDRDEAIRIINNVMCDFGIDLE